MGRPKEASLVLTPEQVLGVRTLVAQAGVGEVTDFLDRFSSHYGEDSTSELGALLSYLRALAFLHQTHHWQTRGPTFYADHLLFERLYNETLPLIDSLAERSVGSGSLSLVNPVIQGAFQFSIIKDLYSDALIEAGPEQCVHISLKGVLNFLALLRIGYARMEDKGLLSHGIDNLLQGISDTSETFLYLLQQRAGGRAASRTASDWKTK